MNFGESQRLPTRGMHYDLRRERTRALPGEKRSTGGARRAESQNTRFVEIPRSNERATPETDEKKGRNSNGRNVGTSSFGHRTIVSLTRRNSTSGIQLLKVFRSSYGKLRSESRFRTQRSTVAFRLKIQRGHK